MKRKTTDFRPETFKPDSAPTLLGWISTANGWKKRRDIVLNHVYTSFARLLEDSSSDRRVSLAVIKPTQVTGFEYEADEREWPEAWLHRNRQLDLFRTEEDIKTIRKVPYNFYYRFTTESDPNPHRIMVTDWEIGALYWNCMKTTNDDEKQALQMVRQKYFCEFTESKDLYFIMGSHFVHHAKGYPNPFMIVGVFYPPRDRLDVSQLNLGL